MKRVESHDHRPPRDAAVPEAIGRPPDVERVKPDGIRDTIESIIVAFILAFVFRAFVVEAFVIPTGSMAPGLYGKHGEYRCEACQYAFSYGIRDGSRQSPGTLDTPGGFTVECPNCGWSTLRGRLNPARDHRVVPHSGDRILVLKWPYDIGGDLLGPKRWDVVVFKNPQDGETNFIKRLLGLPGEVLEIINGDIYSAAVEDVPPDILQALKRPPIPLSDGGRPASRRLTRQQQQALAQVLTIRRKTRAAQESLWMIHYDHDHVPDRRLLRGRRDIPRWEPTNKAAEAAWDASTPLVRFQPPDGREHWLRLAGKPIQDKYGYNSVVRNHRQKPPCHVGDVRVRFVLFPQAAPVPSEGGAASDGRSSHLSISLRKGADEFRASIEADGLVNLSRSGKGGLRVPLQTARIDPLHPDRPLTIEFENVDYRVALRIDDEEIVATDDRQYAPNVAQLLEGDLRDGRQNRAAVAIGAQALPLEIRHLAVHRDAFYRSTDANLDRGNPTKQRDNPFAGYPGWGTATNPILLRTDPPNYFCCGDNSPQSKDSRLWWEVCPMLGDREGEAAYQYGTVPGDQMIGRAFFVYWPGGLRLTKETPAVIPNLGRMRIIR